jgi:AcrR family transcriptional regulator
VPSSSGPPALDGRSAAREARTEPSGSPSAADLRRLLIVEQAAHLFDDAGYGKTSMDDIARAVRIAKPTLYHYFPSKDEILVSIHEEFIDLLIDRHRQREPLGLTAGASLFEHVADVLGLMETHHGHVRVFFEHHRELPAAKRGRIDSKREQYQRFVRDTVEAGMRTGEFRQLDPTITTLAIFGMCNWAYQWFSVDGPLGSREIAAHFWELLGAGLRAPVPAAPAT